MNRLRGSKLAAIGLTALVCTSVGAARTANQDLAPRMKAIVYHDFGSPDVLRLEEIDKPVPTDDQILVRVRAASVNPLDWHYMEGTPYIARPLEFGMVHPSAARLGVDYAGTVEAVGKNVTKFKPGQDVFGGKSGAFAEYICANADRAVVLMPPGCTFEQAASLPIAAITALQSLRDRGGAHAGQKILINGASGGVGTFAVQIAKSFGADVTGVCSTRNLDLVRSLGAAQVIDYTKEDFTERGLRYDLIIDNVGNHSFLECRRALEPDGKYVLIGGGGVDDGRWIGPLINPIKMLLLSPFASQEAGVFLADLNPKDLEILGDLMRAGKLSPVIDRRYKLSEVPDAIRYLEAGHARGKVVITMDDTAPSPANIDRAAGSSNAIGAVLIALALVGGLIGMTIAPIVAALIMNRRFQRRHPGKRPFRWGFYFAILSFIGGLGLGNMIGSSGWSVIVCGLAYASLAWCFARRQRWAWIALTIVSFNPIAWIINLVYLRKRWTEDAEPSP